MTGAYMRIQKGKTHVEAYEFIEEELHKYGFPPKYTSYESFKVNKKHFRSNKNQNIIYF